MRNPKVHRSLALLAILSVALALLVPASRDEQATADDVLDPAHNVALPCEAVSTPGLVPRTAKDLAHVANVCGFVGTDVEFQSRVDASGGVRDYAFLGTMGAGLRIFEITDPAHPVSAGAYTDPGWQNDVQVRGNTAVVAFDPIAGRAPTLSACLQAQGASGGEDILRLAYDPTTGNFTTALLGCVSHSPGGGAHNTTLHPGGDWLAVSNPRGQGSVDVVDLRGTPTFRYRIVQNATLANTSCTTLRPPAVCVSNGRAGTWSPHDISFSADGGTMYVAAVGNDTVILDVTNVLGGAVSIVGIVPNDPAGDGVANDPHDISISHQSDPSADGKILVITDERGGGLQETRCNRDPNGVIGGAHFWALAPIEGQAQTADASPATPRRLGAWFYPNPLLAADPLDPLLRALPRTERGCTIHVLRNGGNGSAGSGPSQAGFDGVSRLPARQLAVAHYGAGVWHLDFSGPSSPADGIAEDPHSTWGNTLGWNVMPGADTWSAKEYKGFIYAGDMGRGFDVYGFASCEGLGCLVRPQNTPGSATGRGQLDEDSVELVILRGTNAGGRASFNFDVQFVAGSLAPSGHLTFRDRGAGKEVKATAIDSFTAAAKKATFTGRAVVDGTPGVSFFVEVEDLGDRGVGDTFRIVLGDGYGAAGVLRKGDIVVQGGIASGAALVAMAQP